MEFVHDGAAARVEFGAAADDDLVLTLGEGVTVLPSTVERLLRAEARLRRPLAARLVPFDEGGVAADRGCVLGTVADAGVDQEVDVLASAIAARTLDPGGLDSAYASRPEQVAASLLETALASAGLSGAAEHVARDWTIADTPKLSIVMRTQFRRPETLRDVLLCLATQTDRRFELLIVAHDIDPGVLVELLEEQPDWLADRTHVLRAEGGTRSHPLNVGLAAARGTHLAVLDDDDVVTSDWVGAFLGVAESKPRVLIRAAAAVQRMTTAAWEDGLEGHAPVGALTTPYPEVFELAAHLVVNQTPFMAFAFPVGVLRALGGADEALDVCEDWDLVLRVAMLTGVVDTGRVTAVYRRWNSGGDSYSGHSSEVWNRDMAKVREKARRAVALLPPGSSDGLADLSRVRQLEAEIAALRASTSWRLTRPLRAVSRFAARPAKSPIDR